MRTLFFFPEPISDFMGGKLVHKRFVHKRLCTKFLCTQMSLQSSRLALFLLFSGLFARFSLVFVAFVRLFFAFGLFSRVFSCFLCTQICVHKWLPPPLPPGKINDVMSVFETNYFCIWAAWHDTLKFLDA